MPKTWFGIDDRCLRNERGLRPPSGQDGSATVTAKASSPTAAGATQYVMMGEAARPTELQNTLYVIDGVALTEAPSTANQAERAVGAKDAPGYFIDGVPLTQPPPTANKAGRCRRRNGRSPLHHRWRPAHATAIDSQSGKGCRRRYERSALHHRRCSTQCRRGAGAVHDPESARASLRTSEPKQGISAENSDGGGDESAAPQDRHQCSVALSLSARSPHASAHRIPLY